MIQAETLELLEWPRLCQHLSTFAATKLGKIACSQLKIPQTRWESQELLEQTVEISQLEGTVYGGLSFEGIEDIGESLERAAVQGILSGAELLAIATTLSGVRRLRRVIEDQQELPILKALVADVRTYPELEQEIHRCIDDRGEVADRASAKLADIRTQLKAVRDRIYQILQGILQRQGNAVSQQVITQRGDRFVIPVRASHKEAIPGIVHDTSKSGETLYIEPNAIVSFGNQLRQHRRREQAEEEVILQALSQQVEAVKQDIEQLLAVATTLDMATARARYSNWLEANPPRFIEFGSNQEDGADAGTQDAPDAEMERITVTSQQPPVVGAGLVINSNLEPTTSVQNPPLQHSQSKIQNPKSKIETSPITLRQLRHPLLVWQQKHEQGVPVVPIDLIINPQIRVVTITGPNTGGKTVTLKTLALAALMAKVGLFVPAREPVEIPWFEQVLADIGDEQSLQQSLSTFSGHIRRISRILAALAPGGAEEAEGKLVTLHPTPSTLILLDEVGAGTDPAEGSALAIALLQYLADNALLTIATTHYGELKALKYEDERFENASVEFDDQTLSPTYRLLWGIPGRSNALTIARRLGLDPEIVATAQNLVGGYSEDVNQVIAGLEAQRRRQETKAQEAAKLLQQAERLHQEVAQKATALKQREQELKLSQERAVQEEIDKAKGEIASVIRRLQQGPMTAQEAQKATNSLKDISERHLPSRKEPPKPKPEFKPEVGTRIRIPRLGQTAEVLNISEDEEELTVKFGLMKMTVKLADIESLDGQKPAQTSKAKAVATTKKEPEAPKPVAIQTSQNTIDIRGARVADAEIELDRAIAKASAGPIWIIHGKGTGKLREGVQEFLKQHPQVERFELAPQAEGGSGVTIAHIN